MAFHPLNLALRFLLETAALVAIGYGGFSQHTGIWRFLLGIGLPVIAAAIWGTFPGPAGQRYAFGQCDGDERPTDPGCLTACRQNAGAGGDPQLHRLRV